MKYKMFDTVVILNPEKTKEEQAYIIHDIARHIATVAQTKTVWIDDSIGVKKLAYPLKGKTSGYYCVFCYIASTELNFNLEPHIADFLHTIYPDDVLKHIVVSRSSSYSTEQDAYSEGWESGNIGSFVEYKFYDHDDMNGPSLQSQSQSQLITLDALDIIFNLK